ncbi:MAG TPA: glycosyltransferase [Methylocella sp.]|nr:glycosyltransferase [Methylocella sp.]
MRKQKPAASIKREVDPGGESKVPFSQALSRRSVAIVHPAWHSCGSHQVFVSQARAYRSLGAELVSLAIADTPGCVDGSRAAKAYFAATDDLEADARFFAGMPLKRIWSASFRRATKQWLHGNDAAMRLEIARQAAIPDAVAVLPRLGLIHCNHFFCVPVAVRLQERHACPILLDTHDLQTRQYALRNQARLRLPPKARYEALLEIELEAMRSADLLIHLNDEEATVFKKLLPAKRHALLHPAVTAMPAGTGGGDVIIVASANYPNFLGLSWFLQEVLPLAPGVPVRILGNIDLELKARAPDLYKAHAAFFRGRVEAEDLHAAYRTAAAVLLPATAGHGVSIKTIEALSCGAPLIATPLAFRGLGIDLASLSNVTLAEDAAGFAAALRRAATNRHLPDAGRETAATRQLYEKRFALEAYRKSLWTIAQSALEF